LTKTLFDHTIQAFHDVGVIGKPEAYEAYMRKQGSKYDGKPGFDPGFFT